MEKVEKDKTGMPGCRGKERGGEERRNGTPRIRAKGSKGGGEGKEETKGVSGRGEGLVSIRRQ